MDPLAPRTQPAKSIYSALVKEAKNRSGRMFEVWVEAERQAVLAAAIRAATSLDLVAPSLAEVEQAEALAHGHADYMAKFARGVANRMRPRR